MRKNKIIWMTVLVISVLLLVGYGMLALSFPRYGNYGPGYYDKGMMGRLYRNYGNQNYNNKNKLTVDEIKSKVNSYIRGFDNNLGISDMFIYKDTDYYVSIEEKDTGNGAVELLVNPYTGDIYPEYGPNMMWNQKYGMMGGRSYGMMGPNGWGMMGRTPWNKYNGYQRNQDTLRRIDREEAVKNADNYVKNSVSNELSAINKGHEFYGYYTFHVNKGNDTIGMISVNYYTGDIWYHNWHGQLEQVISKNEE